MHIYSQMYKYNLLSVYIATWRHHFRDYCLVSDDQLMCSSLGKTFSHVQYLLVAYSPLFGVFLGLFPVHFIMSVGILLIKLILGQ